jgi:hypothetical protein
MNSLVPRHKVMGKFTLDGVAKNGGVFGCAMLLRTLPLDSKGKAKLPCWPQHTGA